MGPPPPPIVVSLPEVPEDNGYDNFVRAADLYIDTGASLYIKRGVPIAAADREALEANGPALAELRRGLQKECVAPFQPQVTFAPQGRTRAFSKLAFLLIIESRLASDSGRYSAAIPPLLDALRFATKQQVGSDMRWRLDARMMQLIVLVELRNAVCAHALRDRDLRSLLQDLLEIEAMAPPIEQVLAADHRAIESDPLSQAPDLKDRLLGLTPEQIAHDLRYQRDEALLLARKGYAHVLAATEPPSHQLPRLPRTEFIEILRKLFRSAVADDFGIRCHLRGTQVLVAVELYRRSHGKPPQSLQHLASLDIDGDRLSVIDPLTGEPFIYEVRGDEYLLYSIGLDLSDDGAALGSISAHRPGDLIFHKPTAKPTGSDHP